MTFSLSALPANKRAAVVFFGSMVAMLLLNFFLLPDGLTISAGIILLLSTSFTLLKLFGDATRWDRR